MVERVKPERYVEDYFNRRVKECGGDVRKLRWVGRRHAPDRLVLFPGAVYWVELKRPGAQLEPGQARELDRLRSAGQHAVWLDSRAAVDIWLREIGRAAV